MDYDYKYVLKIYDVDLNTVAWIDCDSESEAEELLDRLDFGGGGTGEIIRYSYDNGKYVGASVMASKV